MRTTSSAPTRSHCRCRPVTDRSKFSAPRLSLPPLYWFFAMAIVFRTLAFAREATKRDRGGMSSEQTVRTVPE